jgi:hypothetical protein
MGKGSKEGNLVVLAQFEFLYSLNRLPERSPIPTESGEDEVFRHEVIP